jgi:hypothetical protein
MTEETKTIRRTKIHSKTVIEIIFFISLSLLFHLNTFLSILYLSFCPAIPTKHNFRFSRQYILMFYNYTLFFDYFFFWIQGNPTPRKAHFVGSGERVKPRLSQALTRGARPDSNSRPAVQISNPLPYSLTTLICLVEVALYLSK